MAKTQKKAGAPPTSRTAQRRKSVQPVQQTKKQIALGRKQARQNRIIWLSVAALGVVLIAIVAMALVREVVLAPATAVAVVNGDKIRTDDYQALLRYRRYTLHANSRDLEAALQSTDPNQEGNDFLISFYQQQLEQVNSALTTVTETTLDELIDAQLVEQKAAEVGITVTRADVTQAIDDDLRQAMAPPAATEPVTGTETVPTPTAIPQDQVDTFYQQILGDMQLSSKEFEKIVERSLYQQQLQDYLATQVPTTGMVIDVQLIVTDTLETATAAKDRIAAGESFADVAAEVSGDTQTASDGGDTGPITPDQLTTRYGEPVATQATLAAIGTLEQVESNGKFIVMQVVSRDENGALPESVVTQNQNSALSNWLDQRRVAPDVTIERRLDPSQIPPDPFATP